MVKQCMNILTRCIIDYSQPREKMPTLHFKGKNIIWNHHLSVPYHTLQEDKKLHFQHEKSNGNIIVEGDNLTAIKALLPLYSGKIKCIYIDPPYNTGNEGWVYNDKVNSPLINNWLGKTVDKNDLTKHDKWLCMMVPRIKLLRELMTDDGVIFISIDEHEINSLKSIMDEVFGELCLVSHLSILTNPKGRVLDKYFSTNHEYILVYSKSLLQKGSLVVKKSNIEITKDFPLVDDDGRYRELELRNTHREFGKHNRKNLYYPFYFKKKNNILSLEDNGGLKIEPNWDDGYEGLDFPNFAGQ